MTRTGRLAPRYTLLAVATLSFFSTMVGRLAISPIIPRLTDAYLVSKSEIGLVLSGMWAGYALMQFPSGLLGERIGEHRVVALALLLTGSSSLLLSLAPTFLVFAASVVLLGLGAGLYFSVAASILTGAFDNVGQALGFHGAGGPIAGVLTPIVASYLAVRFGWRASLALGAVTALPACLLFVAVWQTQSFDPEDGGTGPSERDAQGTSDGGTTAPAGDQFGFADVVDILTRRETAVSFVAAALCFLPGRPLRPSS